MNSPWGWVVAVVMVIAFLGAAWELCQNFARQYQRREGYKAARARADKLGRPLVVVGDPAWGPSSRVFGPNAGYGDVCLDLTGCPGATVSDSTQNNRKGLPVVTVKGDAIPELRKMGDDTAVVFCSFVLEYVDDVREFYREMRRIAGDVDNVTALTVHPYTWCALFHNGEGYDTKWRIFALEPEVSAQWVGAGTPPGEYRGV
jgi:hypothetical protein